MGSIKLVRFGANWCVLCNEIDSLLEELGIEYDKVDTDENPNLVQFYDIDSVPTLIMFDNDYEVKRVVGSKVYEKQKLQEWISHGKE